MSTHTREQASYWAPRLRQRGANPAWQVRLSLNGKQRRVSLGTANKTEGAKRAATFWRRLQATGGDWAEAAASIDQFLRQRSGAVTIGDWLEHYEGVRKTLGVRRKTAQCYNSALRNIAAMIVGIDTSSHPKRADRRDAIDALPLSKINKRAIDLAVKRAVKDLDDAAAKSALRNLNIKLRNARNLFSGKARESIGLKLDSSPFDGVEIRTPKPKKYSSTINITQLLGESKSLPRNQRLAVILAACAGLRRSEIDSLLWNQVDLGAAPAINIRDTWAYQIKSESSERTIPLSPDVAEFLAEQKSDCDDGFLLNGNAPLLGKKHYSLRCSGDFQQLYSWLRAQGCPQNQPLHALRKEFGSLVNQQGGVVAAQTLLGHSDLKTTASIYVEDRSRVTISLSGE
jgi:integrase